MSLNRHDGVIGACAAHFLSLRGNEVIVIERAEVAAAASGKAGGFLGLDWCADTPRNAMHANPPGGARHPTRRPTTGGRG
jgi:glycine/D-amino acid oxidase-like deaminating enzyme